MAASKGKFDLSLVTTEVQKWLYDHCIEFHSIPPGAPHLNGKAERSQAIDLQKSRAFGLLPSLYGQRDLERRPLD